MALEAMRDPQGLQAHKNGGYLRASHLRVHKQSVILPTPWLQQTLLSASLRDLVAICFN